uniref:Uncharacterized protein n=1 Tax=Panagrolaimus sp. ES5 TaxID=591445 RepID=A0AC34G7P3_9BILA
MEREMLENETRYFIKNSSIRSGTEAQSFYLDRLGEPAGNLTENERKKYFQNLSRLVKVKTDGGRYYTRGASQAFHGEGAESQNQTDDDGDYVDPLNTNGQQENSNSEAVDFDY